jgi:bacillolysin
MKKVLFLLTSFYFITSFCYSQVKESEITSKNSRGNAELINFKETKIKSDKSSVNDFLKKQHKCKNEIEFKEDSKSIVLDKQIESKKYQQFYKGVKVEFGIQNSVSENGNLKTVNGKYVDIQNIGIKPKLTEREALNFALKEVGAKEYMWEKKENEEFLKKEQSDKNATFYPNGEIVIIEKDLFGEKPTPTLAYKFNIYASNPLSRDYIYIDANNGEVLLKDPIIKHIQGSGITRYSGQRTFETQQNGTQYKLRDYSRGNGIETYNMNRTANYAGATDFIDNDNNWTSSEYNNANKDNAALDAHWGTEKTYDYFLLKHNRNSYNNNGAVLKNYVHANLVAMGYPSNDNAFWDGQRMTYGDGTSSFDALTSVDVVGHEIGHGVCSSTANLLYSKESGAINEGLSDIWGAMIEYYADPTKQTYLIGEEIKLGGGALRSMFDPNTYGQPKTYGGTYWYDQNCTPTYLNDFCGVHRNSGVFNHWFYILAEGKTGTNELGNSYNVTGISKEKAAKIVYRAESVYFTATTNYSQARDLTIQATKDLYGVYSAEAVSVCQAWYAVGVGNNNCILPLVITGNEVICSSTTNYTYSISNLVPNTLVNWSVSTNSLILISSTNSTITIKPINSSFIGFATINATVSGIVTSKKIWIGLPAFTFVRDKGEYCDSKWHNVTYILNLPPASSFSLDYINPQPLAIQYGLLASGSYNTITFKYGKAFTGNIGFGGIATNICGEFIVDTYEAVKLCSQLPTNVNNIGSENYYKIFPNPTSNIINVSLNIPDYLPQANSPINAELYNMIGELKKTEILNNNSASINVEGLPLGIYILKIFINDTIETHQVVIQ